MRQNSVPARWPPRWTVRQWAVAPTAPSSSSESGALTGDPGHSRGQEGGGSIELFAAISFGRSRLGAPSGPTPFQRGGCGQPSGLVDLRAAFTEPCRPSDVSVVTRRHARPALSDGFSSPPLPTDALSVTRSSRMAPLRFDLRARGPRFALPVRVKRAKAQIRLPSC
jgi:hypothetical protein